MLDGASRAPTLGLFIPKKQALIFSGLIFNDLRPYGINEGLAGMREIRQRKKKKGRRRGCSCFWIKIIGNAASKQTFFLSPRSLGSKPSLAWADGDVPPVHTGRSLPVIRQVHMVFFSDDPIADPRWGSVQAGKHTLILANNPGMLGAWFSEPLTP